MILLLFWFAVALIVYTYLLFPILLILRAFVCRLPYKTDDATPPVTVIIAVHNEEESVASRIQNIRAQDYPAGRVELVIASDGSDDRTDAIVGRHADSGTKLLSLNRGGKGEALNAAVEQATHDILVFSDANTAFAPDAMRALVRPFADPKVGGVAGNQIYLKQDSPSLTADGERFYWSFDRLIKQAQARAGSVTSATGAIYAIRKSLYRPVPPGAMDDFIISTAVVAKGYRLAFASDATAYEYVASAAGHEYARKIRVITQGLAAVLVMRSLLNPLHYGFYSLQLFTHKVLRRLMVLPLIVLLVISPWLWHRGLVYQATTIAQAAFYTCAVFGVLLRSSPGGQIKVFTVPYYFCMVNLAALVSVLSLLRGRRVYLWDTQRPGGGVVKRPASPATHQGRPS